MIGLTGGIGSGKSTVASHLCHDFGFNSVSADGIAADILGRPGSPLEQLRDLIGDRYFFDNGALDRVSFRKTLFSDDIFREKVDDLLHPLIRSVLKQEALALELEDGKPVVAEIPLLYEAGCQDDCSAVVVVYAPRSVCLKRLVKRDKLIFSEAEKAWEAQESLEKKVLLADHVIDNSGVWLDTLLQIKRLGIVLSAKSA